MASLPTHACYPPVLALVLEDWPVRRPLHLLPWRVLVQAVAVGVGGAQHVQLGADHAAGAQRGRVRCGCW